MIHLPDLKTCTVAIIGLGYVGLPLAIEFSKKQNGKRDNKPQNLTVIGFDTNINRIEQLKNCFDVTTEVNNCELAASHITFTSDTKLLVNADVFLVSVPTPIDKNRRPDLEPLLKASEMIGVAIKNRSSSKSTPIIIYESTVYPGATEEDCVPIIELYSGLKYNHGFVCGYSPERINPGDKKHTLTSIVKVTSGSTKVVGDWVDAFYGSILSSGTYKAESIQIAEAAKVIENIQRDLNIALVNEFSLIFRRLGIDTLKVLKASESKWNFLPFKPGLVGGHCIGVDPYYLTHKAQQVGYYPEVVLAGRRLNDNMSNWLAEQIVLELSRNYVSPGGSNLLILGFTFKENCSDIRNTKISALVNALQCYKINVSIVDPVASALDVKQEYNLDIYREIPTSFKYDALLVAVAHDQFKSYDPVFWRNLLSDKGLIFDLKGMLPDHLATWRP